MTPMRLGVFQTAFAATGGAEVLAATQAAWLAGQGLDVTVASFAFDEEAWRPLFGNIPFRRIPKRTPLDPLFFWSKLMKLRLRGPAVAKALGDFDAVLAHSHPTSALLGHADIPGRKLWYCHEAPWRLHPEATDYLLIKGLDPFKGRCDGGHFGLLAQARDEVLARSRRSRGLARYDLEGTAKLGTILANSAFAADTLARIHGRKDIRVAPPIVRFGESQPRQGLDHAAPGVLVMARLELLKNVETVLRGFARYRRGKEARLHVVGDGRQRARLERVAAELGIQASVTFHGMLDPVRDAEAFEGICSVCDAFALLPLDESFGLVYPEAASRGLLLIGPEQGGPAEILDHGRLGRLAPALDEEAFAAALDATLSMADAAADRQREAADRACRSRFSVEVAGPLLKNVLFG